MCMQLFFVYKLATPLDFWNILESDHNFGLSQCRIPFRLLIKTWVHLNQSATYLGLLRDGIDPLYKPILNYMIA